MKGLKYIISFGIILTTLVMGCKHSRSDSEIKDQNLSDEEYIAGGKAIAQSTFESLGGALKNAISKGGVPYALEYCNLEAIPITDSISQINNVRIKRTSLKTRNSDNNPSDFEKEYLNKFAELNKASEKMVPMLAENADNQKVFFAPIIINDFCLQCHGTPGDEIAEEHFKIIQSKYPGDNAWGYSAGDLRGMWSITYINK